MKVCHWCFISTEFEQTSLEDSQNIVPPGNRTPKGPQSKSNENCYKAPDIGGSMAKRELTLFSWQRGLKDSQTLARYEPFKYCPMTPNY